MPKRLILFVRSLFAAVAVIGALFAAHPAKAQTLQDALTNAYNTNPQLLAERANLRATDENVPQALANWRPTVQVTGSEGIQHNASKQDCGKIFEGFNSCANFSTPQTQSLTTTGSGSPPILLTNNVFSQNLSPQTYGVTIVQPLYRGGRTEAQTEQALNLVRSERAHLLSIEQGVLLNAVTDYMNVVRDQATLDLNVNNEQVLRRQLEATQDRFRVGEVTRTDVAQAEAAYAAAIAARQAAEGTLQISRSTYERDVGQPPGKLAPPNGVPELPTSRDEATGLALNANPDVVSAQFAQQAAEDNVRLVRGQLLPTWTVNAGIQRLKETGGAGQTLDEMSLTTQLTVPLYDGGAFFSQSRQAQQTVDQRRSQVDTARLTASQLAAQAWEQLVSDRGQIVSQRAQIKANEIALDGVQQEASVGSRTVLDILNAEQTLFQSRVNLVASQHDEVVAEFSLADALGRLTARQLNLPVAYYDPEEHFDAVRDKWVGFGDK
ncbi:MAG: TolC family outer membrane protein [Aliidongia sp.]